jgi:hypothetical protein
MRLCGVARPLLAAPSRPGSPPRLLFAAHLRLGLQEGARSSSSRKRTAPASNSSVEASNEYSASRISASSFCDVRESMLESKQGRVRDQRILRLLPAALRQRLEGWFDDQRPPPERQRSRRSTAKALPKKPGIRVFHGEENRAEEAKGKTVYVINLEGDDAAELDTSRADRTPTSRGRWACSAFAAARRLPRAKWRCASIATVPPPPASIPRAIAGLVGYALRGSLLPKFNDGGREIPVSIRFEEADRETLSELGGFQVPTGDGGRVTLSALTEGRVQNAPRSIFRSDKTNHPHDDPRAPKRRRPEGARAAGMPCSAISPFPKA